MKQIRFNPSLGVLMIVVLLGTGFYFVKAQTTWLAPTQPFPNDQPEPPLDTSNQPQNKKAPITITDGDKATEINFGRINFFVEGGAPATKGSIIWNSVTGQFSVIEGTKAAVSLVGAGNTWRATSTGIFVSSTVRVGIGVISPTTNLDVSNLRATNIGINALPRPNTPLYVIGNERTDGWPNIHSIDNNYLSISNSFGYAGRFDYKGGAATTTSAIGVYGDSSSTTTPRGGTAIGGYFTAGGNNYNTGLRVWVAPPSAVTVLSTNIALEIGDLAVGDNYRKNYAIFSRALATSSFAGPIEAAQLCMAGVCKSNWAAVLGVTGAGDTDYLPLWTSASTIGTSTIYQSSADNNVGIGTTGPNAKLDVNGNIVFGSNLDGVSIAFLANSAKGLMGWNRSAGAGEIDLIANRGAGNVGGFRFIDYTNAEAENTLVTMQGSGNVGIGLSNPASKLSVADGMSVGANYSTILAPVNGAIIEGRVGIGLIDPKAKLDVFGDIRLGGTGSSDSASWGIQFGDVQSDEYLGSTYCGPGTLNNPCPNVSAGTLVSIKLSEINTVQAFQLANDDPNKAFSDINTACNNIGSISQPNNFFERAPVSIPPYASGDGLHVFNCKLDQGLYTIRNNRGDLKFTDSSANPTFILYRGGSIPLVETVGPLTINANLNNGTSTPFLNLKTDVTRGSRGVTEHKIFGPYNDKSGDFGALYIGAGKSANLTGSVSRNNIYLYNTGCAGDTCNVPKIHLFADELRVNVGNKGDGPLMVDRNWDGKYYAVYAP
ncbi:MAG: hypothetical protein QMD65_03160 [Patescibacteria group bacterium]|nr:hypothetical protein [Patescibacteria group bacterium]